MHADPVAAVVLAIAVILLAAKVGGDLMLRLGQPAVLGELLAGVVLGNLSLVGFDGFEYLKEDASVDMLARLGVLILLFEVGLESTVAQMLRVGWTALLVAVVGVAVPMALGWGASALLMPRESWLVHAFVGATLCATSVGITARVLKDLGRSQTFEARVILGAAVIDDVLGLVVLAVVTGIIAAADQGTRLSGASIGLIIAKATIFLVGSLAVGVMFSRHLFSLAARLRPGGLLLALGVSFCFVLAWLADAIGLAPIVGAFAAGLILEDVHERKFLARGERPLLETIEPIAQLLVPIFFVLMGVRTDLRAFGDAGLYVVAGALTAAAILGKQACSLVVRGSLDRLSIGIGMVPRGEVGLIFANIGAGLTIAGHRVIDASVYSAVVIMVILTTMATPPALKWSMARKRENGDAPDRPATASSPEA
ncbi:MAG TPA: cation:proton antiporter [Haliangiales bacterium]|nr:cation:proton antiporter [Haliangiales bacterium]